MYKDTRVDLMVMGAMLFIGIIIAAILIWITAMQCDAKAISFKEHRWGIFSGCMVKHKDMWLPLENLRGFDDK